MKPALDYLLALCAFALTGLGTGTVDADRPAGSAGASPEQPRPRLAAAPPPPPPPQRTAPESARDLSAPDRESTRGGTDPAASPGAASPTHGDPPGVAVDAAAQDRAFVEAAARLGQQEIVDARAALGRASRAAVREAAQVWLDERSEAHRRLQRIADRKGWSLPGALPTPTQIEGADFDHAFAQQQVRAQERSLALFRAQADSDGDPELRTFARATVPTLEHHLEIARALRQDTAPHRAGPAPAPAGY